MGVEEQDEAMGRLGGPSRLIELEQKVAELELVLDTKTSELQKAVETNRVQVGRQLTPTLASSVAWRDGSGGYHIPSELCLIEGLGYDWCVIRNTVGDEVYFGTSGVEDIRYALSTAVMA